MAEFSVAEQMQLTQGMSDQQNFLFHSQYSAVRKDRTPILVVSIFLGGFGIDRFPVGDISYGLLKLLTGGVRGIFWIVDWFPIMGRADDFNRRKAYEVATAIKINTPHP